VTERGRFRILLVVVAVVVVTTSTYVFAKVRDDRARTQATRAGTAAEVPTGPRIVFRNTTIDGTNGEVAAVPLDDPGGRRAFLGVVCDRVDANERDLACLSTRRGVVTTFGQTIYRDGEKAASWSRPGIPSRTRLSPSGRLVADTVFVSGHSYVQTGFSTATEIREVGGRSFGNLERFDLYVDGRLFAPVDRNFWGVTFVDDRTFYATAASGDRTWLVKGDLPARTLTALRSNAECPSVSPDATKVAYKTRARDDDERWDIAVLDLASGTETVLGEKRGVDDQVAWLDDTTLMYGLPRASATGVTDVWTLGTDAGASPELLIENAWSPAAVA
jgi:hypothetical protein